MTRKIYFLITALCVCTAMGWGQTLTVTPSTLEVPRADGSISFDISHSGGGTYSISKDASASWVTFPNFMGTSGNQTIKLNVIANIGTAERTATITVRMTGVSLISRTVTVKQAGVAPFLTVTPENLEAYPFGNWAGNVLIITVTSNVAWTPEVAMIGRILSQVIQELIMEQSNSEFI